MSDSSTLEIKHMQDEKDALEAILTPYIQGGEAVEYKAPSITTEDLDRAAADAAATRTLSTRVDPAKQGNATIADGYKRVQNEQRIRRDTTIVRQNHKRLMMGALETLYRRQKTLEARLADAK